MSERPSDDASAHVLDAAERLFLERGFDGARLRDVAAALGIRSASLYYHAPGGKRELWERVLQRALDRHRAGLRQAADASGADLRAQLVAMAGWLVSQPPVNVVAVATSRMSATVDGEAPSTAERLYESLMTPVADAFVAAQRRGDIAPAPSADLLAGVFVSAMNGLLPAAAAGALPRPAEDLAAEIVDILIDGVRPR